ncbi:MAG: zinc ribbon domain-containing protein [Pyrinomonadaceae bacterium]
MKICGACGFANDNEMRFCVECGNALAVEPQMVVPLGNPASENPTDSFADETVVRPANLASVATISSKNPKNRSYLKIVLGIGALGILLVLFAAGGIGTAIYLTMNREEPPTPTPYPTPTPKRTPKRTPTPEPTETPLITVSTPEEPTPEPTVEDPDEPITEKETVLVSADSEWQVSKIRTVGGEKFKVVASGKYNLEGIDENVGPNGVKGHTDRRIFKQFRTGALLMRTHFPNGNHSNIQAVSSGQFWENYPNEEGFLEFMINDSEYEDNDGELTVRFERTDNK